MDMGGEKAGRLPDHLPEQNLLAFLDDGPGRGSEVLEEGNDDPSRRWKGQDGLIACGAFLFPGMDTPGKSPLFHIGL
jgi:hypothetical protein